MNKIEFDTKSRILILFCLLTQLTFAQKINSYHLLVGVHYGLGLNNDLIGVDVTVQSPYLINFGIIFEKSSISGGNYENIGISVGSLLSNTRKFSSIASIRGFYSVGVSFGGGASLYGRFKVTDYFFFYGGPMLNYFGKNLEAVLFAGAGFKFGKF